MCLQATIDSYAIHNGLYKITEPVISFYGSSASFVFGPVIATAILLSQYLPNKRWAKIASVLVWTTVYSIEELLLVWRGAVVYENWRFVYSVALNAIIVMTLSWFSMTVLKRGGNYN